VRKDEGKIPLGRSSNRGEGNIKKGFKETDLEGLDLLCLAKGMDRWRAV
jgi:hypothetical protein